MSDEEEDPVQDELAAQRHRFLRGGGVKKPFFATNEESGLPMQTLAQFYNRRHVVPLVHKCFMNKELKVSIVCNWIFYVNSFE